MGRKRHDIWNYVAADCLLNASGEDIRFNVQKLAFMEELTNNQKNMLRKYIEQIQDEFSIVVSIAFKDDKAEEKYNKRILELDKQKQETWGAYFKRKRKESINYWLDKTPDLNLEYLEDKAD